MKKILLVAGIFFVSLGIAQQASINVTSPNGGENWALGSTHNITWRSSGLTGNVSILLFSGGDRVGLIKNDVPVAAGSFSWVVGSYQGGTAAPGTNYKVRIRKPQTEILDASDRPFTISGAPPAASLTVTNPNGGETWFLRVLRGNTATVTWTAQNVSGDLTVVLKKGGTPVRTQTFTNAGSCAFSYAGVAEGDDYRIRVESADGSVADESNGNFSIKRETLVAVEAKPISMVLSVSDFKLNNGAETTESSSVTMDHVARGGPTHYRWRNEVQPEWGPWVPYVDGHPVGKLPDSGVEHTIYFQIKNNNGESTPVSDSIRYGEREYEFGPGALADCPCPRGFAITGWRQFKVIEQSFPRNLVPDPTQVTCADNHAGCYWEIVIEVKSLGYMFVRYGTKTEFEFFAGRQLKEGWSFVRLEYEGEEGDGYGYRITRMPQPGSRDITFRVRVWADSNISSCIFRIKRIIVKGPANVSAGAAFQ